MAKSSIRIVLEHIIGFIFFLVFLGIANLIIPYINYPAYTQFIGFLNNYILLFLIMMIIGLFNDLLWNYNFPFNIFAPIISSILSAFIVYFIYLLLIFIQDYYEFTINIPINLLLVIIPLIVLLSGYAIIIGRKGKSYDNYHEMKKRKNHKEDFKQALYEVGDKLNKGLDEIKEKLSDKDIKKKKSKKRKNKR